MKQRANSTFSLPKIKELPEQDDGKATPLITKRQKLLKQIFRPKWGMAPKCLVKGHEGKEVLYLCINKHCQQTTRLICQQCFYTNHACHSTECLALDQIKIGKIQSLRYWPFDEEFKKMFEFVTKHQSYVNNVVQDVNASFNVKFSHYVQQMAVRIMNEIDKMRLNMLKKIDTFYIKQTKKKQFAQNLKIQLQQSFDLKRIQKIVSDLFNKKIKHTVFDNGMQTILNDDEMITKQKKLLDFFDKSDKGMDIQFDKQIFLKKQQDIIKGINQQEISIKNVDVVIGDVKEMQKIIPQALKYLSVTMNNYKDLKFQRRILEDTSEYVGFYSKNMRNLIGMRKYKAGPVYYGQWSSDTRNGYGIYENKATGYKYVGNWKQDRKHGFGREQSLVTIYQGEFFQDKKEGFGVLIKDGCRYEINWKNDKMHGEGKAIEPDGTERPIYYFNGIETQTKKQKVGGDGPMSLVELTKKFSKSSKTKSIISQAKST